ncbi:bifunctional Histone RNA hairpin-binding protein [Babesia duncani]|uniref:Bifunctional Histone RNA hairpin-binding protein n=1 Tax=Babesia duncani TaxID=323732 RepID=A0AAD9PI49_9APIC|nr:bifunctional Histone RNA hairpin-binding protein [Babesia duncani]
MASYRWADVASSESCASFDRTALLILERRNKLAAAAAAAAKFPAPKDEPIDALKKTVHFMTECNSSYVDKRPYYQNTDSKSRVSFAMQVKMTLAEKPEDIPNDDDTAPLEIIPSKANTLKPQASSFAGILDENTTAEPIKSTKLVSNDAKTAGTTPDRISELTTSTHQDVEKGDVAKKATIKFLESPQNKMQKRTGMQDNIYYDDDTKEPMNPTKKVTRSTPLDEVAKKKIESIVIDRFNSNRFNNEKRGAHAPSKDHSARVYSRLKDIAIGKATRGYQNYIKKVPIEERGPDDPQTPNCKENISASLFAAVYSKWRKQLHMYD